MKGFRFLKPVVLVCISVVLTFALGSMLPFDQSKPDQGIALVRPPFVDVVQASSKMDTVVADILDSEAGISAYMKANFSINLTSVRGAFSTIELETADYIIGSIDMPDYPGIFDPHIYVHTDGWILAYYLRADPVSKMLDVRARTIGSTLLYEAISIIASGGGVPVADVKYYDFRYPDATSMMFVAENNTDGNNFTIEIPSSYGYYERSWATGGYYPDITFDGTNLFTTQKIYSDSASGYGYISPGLFTTDYAHNVVVETYGVVVIVYRVP